jgi:hypothetical protein
MSAPPTSLPAEIAELMTYSSCVYEASTGTDGAGQQTYAAGVNIPCWLEGEGYLTAGVNAVRAQGNNVIDAMTREPELTLFFNGSDTRVQGFKLTDRFTPNSPAAQGLSLQPTSIDTYFGPPFDDQAPWLISVSF